MEPPSPFDLARYIATVARLFLLTETTIKTIPSINFDGKQDFSHYFTPQDKATTLRASKTGNKNTCAIELERLCKIWLAYSG